MADDNIVKVLVDDALERNLHPDRRSVLEEWRENNLTDEEREARLTDDERRERADKETRRQSDTEERDKQREEESGDDSPATATSASERGDQRSRKGR